MTTYESVFNCHVNNALYKALHEYVDRFGVESWRKIILPITREGIMSVFSAKPTEEIIYFVSSIKAHVNNEVDQSHDPSKTKAN